ncbi:MAG: ARMT1-like domain-containing protein [Psychromonas sp.]
MNSEGIAEACYSCVLNQARTAAKYAQISEKQTAALLSRVQSELQTSAEKGIVVQHIIRNVADVIIELKNADPQFDIYQEVKRRSNTLAKAYAKELQQQINSSSSPLDTAIQISAAGNIIDFGAKNHGDLDLDVEMQQLQTIKFNHYDIDAFRAHLMTAKNMLYICDNAGEIVFDKLLIQCLQKNYPQLQITAAVRHKPIINDATLADAAEVGLKDVVKVISSGSVYPGTILREASTQFKQLYADADLIIAKGQGNFETLLPIVEEKLFFLLRIKCEQMASLSAVAKGSLVLMQGKQNKG